MPIGLTACYGGFAVAVHLRLLDPFDVAVRNAARPGGWWGPQQIQASRVVSALTPQRLGLALLTVVTLVAVARRSLRPVGVAALVGGPVVLVTVATKWVMTHSDAGHTPVPHGGFPSGHTVTAVVGSGLAVLLVRRRPRWSWLVPGVVGVAVGTALVLADVHPATDVLGGGVLAAVALAAASAAGLGRWARGDHSGVGP